MTWHQGIIEVAFIVVPILVTRSIKGSMEVSVFLSVYRRRPLCVCLSGSVRVSRKHLLGVHDSSKARSIAFFPTRQALSRRCDVRSNLGQLYPRNGNRQYARLQAQGRRPGQEPASHKPSRVPTDSCDRSKDRLCVLRLRTELSRAAHRVLRSCVAYRPRHPLGGPAR